MAHRVLDSIAESCAYSSWVWTDTADGNYPWFALIGSHFISCDNEIAIHEGGFTDSGIDPVAGSDDGSSACSIPDSDSYQFWDCAAAVCYAPAGVVYTWVIGGDYVVFGDFSSDNQGFFADGYQCDVGPPQ
jgi:hypothetical protein